MIRASALAFVCTVLSACEPAGDGGGGEAPAVWRVAPEPVLSVGALDGDSAYLFSRVRTARFLGTDRIAVADGGLSAVRVYDSRGRFVAQLGRPGDGPGEFRDVRGMWLVPPDTIGVWDSSALRLSWFTADGHFVRSVAVTRPADAGVRGGLDAFVGAFSDGSVALAAIAFGSREVGVASPDRMTVERYDTHGTLVEILGEVTGLVRAITASGGGPIPLSPFPSFAVAGDSVAFTDGVGGAVRLWRDASARGRTLRFPQAETTVDAAWRDLEAELTRRAEGGPAPEAAWWLDMMADMPRPDVVPATSGLLVDAEGHIWAKGYRASEDAVQLMDGGTWPRGGPWWVMARDGRIVAAVDVPEGLAPVEVRDGRVLAVGRDALGVERVSVHEVLGRR